jgi:hypothetical protein
MRQAHLRENNTEQPKRHIMMIRILGMLTIMILSACATAPGTERISAGGSLDIASAGTQLSVQRAQGGIIRPLSHSPALQAAAQLHADDLSRMNALTHQGSDGAALNDRLRRAGYTACAAVENVANGTGDIRATIAQWMASPDHRANILNPQVTQFGFADSGASWVLVMARPC